MAQGGVCPGEFDIVSPADEFFEAIVRDMRGLNTLERFEANGEKKSLMFEMGGFLISKFYKTNITTITVAPKEDDAKGSHVTWTFEFVKARQDIVDPYFIVDLFIEYLKDTDKLLKGERMDRRGVCSGEFDFKSPADKFFRSIAEDMSPSDTTPEKKIDWYSTLKSVTIRTSGSQASEAFKTVTTTIIVTPKEDEAEGSHVTWTMEFEKIRHDIDNPYFVIESIESYLKETDSHLNL